MFSLQLIVAAVSARHVGIGFVSMPAVNMFWTTSLKFTLLSFLAFQGQLSSPDKY